MGEYPLFERSQLRAGFEPELAVERIAALAIRGERVGLAPTPVKREHQLPQQPLTVRMHRDERLELADHIAVVTEHQLSLDPVLHRGQPRLLQARDLALSKRLIREIGERLAAPQPQRRVQQLPRASSFTAAERATRVGGHRLETVGVDLTRRHLEQVPTVAREQHLVAQRLAQMRHITLQRFRCGCRWSLAPQLIDQPIARGHLAAAQQQDRKQRPLLRATEHNPSSLIDDLQRPQHSESEHGPLGPSANRTTPPCG